MIDARHSFMKCDFVRRFGGRGQLNRRGWTFRSFESPRNGTSRRTVEYGRHSKLNWFKRNRPHDHPTVCQKQIGEVQCDSSVLLFDDPSAWYAPVRVEGVPKGRHPVHATIIQYPEGGRRVARIAIRLLPDQRTGAERRTLGSVGVDYATVVAVDEAVFQKHWQDVGPNRVGQTVMPNHHQRLAKLISDEFGLTWREVGVLRSEFVEPISEDLERRILDFLNTFPEYAGRSYIYFQVRSHNTLDQIFEVILDRKWSEIMLDERSGASLFAVSTGFGDGCYEVEGIYRGELLRAIEIEFIGPEQDKILETFPMLRY